MKTFQDFLQIKDTDEARIDFIRQAINEHKAGDLYKIAYDADLYFKKRNVTIRAYEKMLYTLEGQAVKDDFSPNYKMASGFFKRFVTQEKSYLLGNGVTWKNKKTADKLGTQEKPFDTQLQDLAEMALIGAVSFGFFNRDHVDTFSVLEFVPLFDEEDGALKAGIRFWQIAPDKPVRATLFELDGYTEYIWDDMDKNNSKDVKGRVYVGKRTYTEIVKTSPADGTQIYEGDNYPSFPIVPLWANKEKQSEIIGIREQIDCFDLIRSGYANNVDEGSIIYWLIQNAGGMEDFEIKRFLDRVRVNHFFSADEEGATAEPHTISYPYEARSALLDRLEKDMYKDAMALNTEDIASGAVTATQIEASYEPLNEKTDGLEYRVIEFINGILALAGIKDEQPTFTRSIIVNTTETISNVLQASALLGETYSVKKILTLLGDGDQAQDVLNNLDIESIQRYKPMETEEQEQEPEQEVR